jgi:hypothetical protein
MGMASDAKLAGDIRFGSDSAEGRAEADQDE